EFILERRLPRGAQMIAIAPPAATSHVLVVRKRRRIEASLEDFVRAGAMSRQMALFLEQCTVARINMFLTGVTGAVNTGLLAALAAASPAGERIVMAHDSEDVLVGHAHIVSLALPDGRTRGEDVVRAASRLRPDRLIVAQSAMNLAAVSLE